MLKQLIQASLVMTGVAVLAGCNIDESFSTDAAPAYTSGTQVVTVTRPVGSSPFRNSRINNSNQVVTRQTTVVVTQPVYQRPSAPARVFVSRQARPVRAVRHVRAPAASAGYQVSSAPQASTGFQADSAPTSTGFQTGSASDASNGFEVN